VSGTGVHVYLEADAATVEFIGTGWKHSLDVPGYGDKQPAVEIYAHTKYAALSGIHLSETPVEISHNVEGLAWLTKKYPRSTVKSHPSRPSKNRAAVANAADASPPHADKASLEGDGERSQQLPRDVDPVQNGTTSATPRVPSVPFPQEEVETRIKDAITRQGPEFWCYYANPRPTRGGGESPSEFDCRLIACALLDGWDRNWIKSLLYVFRLKHNFNPEKALRDDYLDRTIAYVEKHEEDAFADYAPREADSTDSSEAANNVPDAVPDPRIRLERFPNTESGDAERLIALNVRDLRYAEDERCWYSWDQERGCWFRDQAGDMVGRRYLETIRATYFAADRLRVEKAAKELRAWARKGESATRRKNVLILARAEPPIRCKAAEFENHPRLLNVKDASGHTLTLDLETREVRAPSREDKLLHVLDIQFDPAADCPRWTEFIRQISCDRSALARYLQRVFAYCLTGDVGEQVFFFAYGSGANGKSTFVGVMLRLLGQYGQRSMSDTFWAEKNHSRHPVEMADLQGVRLCVIQEIEPGRKWAVERIKQLTGEPETRARHLYGAPFTFTNTAKLFFNGNTVPLVSDHSGGFWRRLRKIPFGAVIPKERRLRSFDEILWKEESSGILNWVLAAMSSVIEGGVGTCPEVEQATEDYRRESDVVSRFMGECCTTGEGHQSRAGELFEAFSRWSARSLDDGAQAAMPQKVFAQRLNQLGYSAKRDSGGISYLGIKLLNKDENST